MWIGVHVDRLAPLGNPTISASFTQCRRWGIFAPRAILYASLFEMPNADAIADFETRSSAC